MRLVLRGAAIIVRVGGGLRARVGARIDIALQCPGVTGGYAIFGFRRKVAISIEAARDGGGLPTNRVRKQPL